MIFFLEGSIHLSWVVQNKTFLSMKCFCNANIVFFIKHLATQLIILIHAKHKINGILGISFPCFCAGFTRIPVTFLSSLAVLTRYSETLKCSAQYLGDHKSASSVKIYLFRVHNSSQLLFHQIVQMIKLWCLLFIFKNNRFRASKLISTHNISI